MANYMVTLKYRTGKQKTGLITDSTSESIKNWCRRKMMSGKIIDYSIRKYDKPLFDTSK
jgi:hypothetical protein